jgi:hypothetical protein
LVNVEEIVKGLEELKAKEVGIARVSSQILLWRLKPALLGRKERPRMSDIESWSKEADILFDQLGNASLELIEAVAKITGLVTEQVINNPQVDIELADIFGGRE